MAGPDTLLIDEGDLASLTLFALQPDPSRLMIFHTRAKQGRLAAAQHHAEICGKSRLIVAEAPPELVPSLDLPEHIEQAQTLLRAAALAMHLRCNRVLWSITIGENHIRVAEALECAATVAQLADPSGSLLLDAPNIDLNDAQLVELADEAGAPMRAFWPCDEDGEEPCASCANCARWMSAFDQAGIEWPWPVVARLSEP